MSETQTPLEPDPATFDGWTASVVAMVRDHLMSLGEQAASDVADAAALRDSFREPPPEEGRPLDGILARLAPAIAKSFNTAGPGYLAFIPGGGVYSAALADYLACSVNRYVGVNATAPALAQIEATAVRWLADFMGYPAGARGVLTSGGSMANLIALATARHARLGDSPFHEATIYASAETHVSVAKAARIAGFPARAIREIPVDDRFRADAAALERLVGEDRANGRMPLLVVANVGSTNTGAIDPIRDVLSVARRHGLWVHADAAYGGFFRLATGGPALMPGVDECDSITLDPHKGLFLPYGTGCVLVRDGAALHAAHRSDAAYLGDVASRDGEIDFNDLSPELSRDFRGLRLWLPLQLHGVAAFRAQLDEKLALARLAHERLAEDPRFEIVAAPQLSVVAFRLRERDGDAGLRGGDARNAELLRRVNARRRVFLSSTLLDGKLTLRICVLSFRTHRARLEEALTTLAEEAAAL